jgi:hypothetical protein
MREHRHHATDATIEALRRLRRAWAGVHVAADAVHVALAEGDAVAIRAYLADVDPELQAVRLRADVVRDAPSGEPPGAFAAGGNDVVIFRSATWAEARVESAGDGAPHAHVQFTGSPLQRTANAVAACSVDDAVVVAARDGTGLLVRCGLRPGTLDVVSDRATIARFLAERHYGDAGGHGAR